MLHPRFLSSLAAYDVASVRYAALGCGGADGGAAAVRRARRRRGQAAVDAAARGQETGQVGAPGVGGGDGQRRRPPGDGSSRCLDRFVMRLLLLLRVLLHSRPSSARGHDAGDAQSLARSAPNRPKGPGPRSLAMNSLSPDVPVQYGRRPTLIGGRPPRPMWPEANMNCRVDIAGQSPSPNWHVASGPSGQLASR